LIFENPIPEFHHITLHDSSDNLIEDNNLSSSGEAVRLQAASDGNTIQNNDMSGNSAGIRDFHGTGSDNRYLNNDISDASWVAITLEGNDSPFEIAGNVFTNSTAVQLNQFSDVTLTAGPSFDIDVADARGGIILNLSTNVTLDGFDVSGTGAGGFDRGIGIHSASTNVTLRNIVARDRDFGILTVDLTDG
jgi:parallel beta-helix repeat protein